VQSGIHCAAGLSGWGNNDEAECHRGKCRRYALGDAKVRMTGEDGKSAEADIKKGGTRWQTSVTHKTEIIGTTPLSVVLVELKEQAK
jgi:hypothetical protein